MSTPATAARRAVRSLSAPPDRARREGTFRYALWGATIISVAFLAWLLIDIFLDGAGRVNSTLLFTYASRFAEEGGIRSGITGTLSLMVLVGLFAFPLGVGAALYLEEFAVRNRLTRLLEANINNLAGVPSIVYGLLGFGIFVGILGWGRNLLVGAISLSLLILPVIIVASREALRAVPRELRAGGLALGATPLQVAFTTTLPAALPGILTGTILALSRAVGETAPILVAGAALNFRQDTAPWEFTQGYTALPIAIFDFVKRPQPEFQIELASASIIVLLVVLLAMNSFAIYLRNRYARSN